jgi:hypothetical protein
MWPVVVSTNYDDLYVAAAHAAHLQRNPRLRAREDRHDVPLILLGRSATDCQRVLTSPRQPDLRILWAVQGYAGGQAACQLDNDRAVEGDQQYEASRAASAVP